MKQNRPYSLNDIFLNLHKDIGKTALQKCLDQLVTSGDVMEKVYGKQKVYVADQSRFPTVNEQELKALEQEVAGLSEAVGGKQQEVQQAEAALKALLSSLTTQDALSQSAKLEAESDALAARLELLRGRQSLVCEEERRRLQQRRTDAVLQWRRRRRMARDVLDAVLEDYPKSKKELFEDVGIETDEDVGVQMPS
ncbi:ous-pairing protein 2 [Trinorchestia longiramus]|nr:ous-pairing protein 2 [Trinorchestia longiramus]